MNQTEKCYWQAYLQINSEDSSDFISKRFRVPKKLYQKIQSAIKRGAPLYECGFYGELQQRAVDEYIRDSLAEIEKPVRKDYDDRDEYEWALEEYQDEVEARSECSIERVDIEDPGDDVRLKAMFVGRRFSALEDCVNETVNFSLDEESDRSVSYSVDVSTDANGAISDVVIIESVGLCSEDVKSSSYEDCYPDYYCVAELLLDELEEELEEED